MVRADLIYTRNGGCRFEEWFRAPATLLPGMKVPVELPEGRAHSILNLIEENSFLISYPEVMDTITFNETKNPYSTAAISVVD